MTFVSDSIVLLLASSRRSSGPWRKLKVTGFCFFLFFFIKCLPGFLFPGVSLLSTRKCWRSLDASTDNYIWSCSLLIVCPPLRSLSVLSESPRRAISIDVDVTTGTASSSLENAEQGKQARSLGPPSELQTDFICEPGLI